ncbi:hypothetical protein ACFYQA_02250 [Streptomyces sp. NPDC005774]|uniref:hypothetical protein n=1 Tax=Streptomyces sp. NPDC005774 TaxID=3364728 RepID=UPI003691807A
MHHVDHLVTTRLLPHEYAEEHQLHPAPNTQTDDLRACLDGLPSVLRPHFSQEEESYFSLAP